MSSFSIRSLPPLLLLIVGVLPVLGQSPSSRAEIDSLVKVATSHWYVDQTVGIEISKNTLQKSFELEYYEGKRKSLTNLGVLFYQISQYDSALNYHQQAFEQSKAQNDTVGLVKGTINMGNVYFDQLALTEGEKVLKTGLDLIHHFSLKSELISQEANVHNTLGLIQSADEKFPEALTSYQSALSLYDSLNQPDRKANVFTNIGNLYYLQDKYEEAISFLKQGITIYRFLENDYDLSTALNSLGAIYFAIREDSTALALFTESKELSIATNNLENLSSVFFNLYISFQTVGNEDSAFRYVDHYLTLKDSLFSSDDRVDIVRMSGAFDTQQERQRRELSEEKREAQQKLFIAGVIIISLLSLLITLYLRNRIRLQRINSLRAAEQQRNEHVELLKEKEVESLQSLMDVQESERARIAKDLHDQLGNSLITARLNVEAIKLKQGDLPEGVIAPLSTTQTSIEQALDQVRSISHDMNTGIMAKFGLRRILQDLVKGIDTAGFMKVNLVMDGKSDHVQRDTSILVYRLTQELINNAVKHSDARSLSVQVLSNEFEVTLTVEDDGKGFEPFSGKSDGMGLTNMLTVVEDAGGELSVESSPGNGATFIISLPINNDE